MIAESTSHIPYITLFALLAAAASIDMRKHRIPNLISLGGAMAGLLMNTGLYGLDGFLAGLGGLSLAFVIMLPFYLLRGMGAGDVKLMAAVGAFIGPHQVLLAVGLTLGAGGIAGLTML
ncbi:MAG: A24 family peptidase, partial [Arenicellales bacterium]